MTSVRISSYVAASALAIDLGRASPFRAPGRDSNLSSPLKSAAEHVALLRPAIPEESLCSSGRTEMNFGPGAGGRITLGEDKIQQ